MSFIARHISGNGERLVYIARIHWIYVLKGAFWFVFLAAAGEALDLAFWYGMLHLGETTGRPINLPLDFSIRDQPLFYLMATTGFLVFFIHIMKYIGTEIALTNNRIIYKTGVFFVTVEELDLSEIKEEKVHHGILGALMGYGEIHLDSRFVGDVTLPAIKNPYKLLKHMHKVRATHAPDHSEQH